MKRVTLLTSLVIAFALVAVNLQADGKDTDEAIQTVILSQIEAFANDDKEAAWSYASDGIRRQSGSADTFYDMVKLSYAPVHRASAIEFLDRIPHPGFQVQVVRLKGPEGKRWRAAYRMVKNGDDWKIGGVSLKAAPHTI